ncbi:hypothetical protein JKP88DRAFT_250987 [Tribonema minus]|uniref:Uncharacterized protein n=1 Tax=Tribonema minus TaxID=303371 RepID=A0A835ZD20_9STRA|nr:hypothetical protein JKP88DRAFT_250987 [Tribonema minus]
MDIITADEAVRLQKGIMTAEQLAVSILSERVDQSIRSACVQKSSSTTVVIPELLWGVPTFDRESVTLEIISLFRSHGFTVQPTHEGRLLIAWGAATDEVGSSTFMPVSAARIGASKSLIDESCFTHTMPAPVMEARQEAEQTAVAPSFGTRVVRLS